VELVSLLLTYADAIALLSSVPNYELAKLVFRMQNGLEEISRYYSSWKIKINEHKTETILHSFQDHEKPRYSEQN